MLIDSGYEGSLSAAGDFAKALEASGKFHGCWVNDTSNDPFLLAQAMLNTTSELKVGTNVAVAFSRSPYGTAQTAFNLAELGRGRFSLGLGTQVKAHIEKRFSMSWPDKPVRAMKEYVTLLRHLFQCFLKGERPSFRGEYFQCTLNSPVFTPDHHQENLPPIGFAAVGPIATQAAAQVADSVFLHPFTHLAYLESVTLPALQKGSKKRDESLGELEVIGSAFCLASDAPDYAKRKAEALGRLAFYASTPNYKAVLGTLGLEELHGTLHGMSRQGQWREMAAALPSDFVDACLVEAPASELPEALQERFGHIYHRVVIDGSLLLS